MSKSQTIREQVERAENEGMVQVPVPSPARRRAPKRWKLRAKTANVAPDRSDATPEAASGHAVGGDTGRPRFDGRRVG